MNSKDDAFDKLLESVDDGLAIDWDAAGSDAPLELRAELHALRDVARIAEFHRSSQREGIGDLEFERWGTLLIMERLGSGASAGVYRAWDSTLQREVALKLLHRGIDDAALLDEGRAAARIRHPNVVTIHGIDRREGRVGLWMEYVRGATLEQEVRERGRFDAEAAARLGREIASALAAVHGAGILHRDLKPANVVRDADGRHVLTDFGLGWRPAGPASRPQGFAGTPAYMAPELLAGGTPSVATDLYALGMVIWFALAGRHPFEAMSLAELNAAARRGPAPPLRELRPDLPRALVAQVERTIAPDPALRYDSATAWIEALPGAGAGTRAPRRRAALVLTGLVVLAVAGFAVLREIRQPDEAGPAGTTLTQGAASNAAPAAGARARDAAPEGIADASATYSIAATLTLRDAGGAPVPLANGDRVRPGDRLSLEMNATCPVWVYVLNEDERGERYLLFPQPLFDMRNPVPGDSALVLPGTVGGRENSWTVTSSGGREHFLIVASPEPVAELETELGKLPAAQPGRPVRYAEVGDIAIERLRGVGGVEPLPAAAPPAGARPFERFRRLVGREAGVSGVWVRQIVLENPGE